MYPSILREQSASLRYRCRMMAKHDAASARQATSRSDQRTVRYPFVRPVEQLLGRRSEETGGVDLLGLIDADVRQLNAPGLPLPHMGWNRVFPKSESPQAKLLFKDIEPGEWFYFVHSFAMPDGPAAIASCTYGEPFAAAAASENFMGVQFHPERSGKAGARLLANFLGAAA